ncbi:hypothetical protein LTR37_019928 [Vermiconidia calcicola]|uniref:Uncharacterized protein n=1 Tax=Vermiconidia calcicola TaxID=1690605 RepID=A0ACC3MCR7_9PEZI|nr:hypothetical protein LTR37_019928 [Vermiconidia calcicola]
MMAGQELAQEEVWDDSALVRSWNEAFEEYKVYGSSSYLKGFQLMQKQKYHTLALKGEKVNLVPEQTEEGLTNGDSSAKSTKQPPQPTVVDDAQVEDLADDQASTGGPPTIHGPAVSWMPALPQALMATVQNEDLKNLMMSWYYAGYYTGLLEGKQQGYTSAMQQHSG